MLRSLLLWAAVGTVMLWAQDPQFSQFYANPLLVNPAFAGTGYGPRIAMSYRRQWAAIPTAFKTFATAIDMPFKLGKTNHGAGLVALVDQAGEGNLTKLDIQLAYAYELPLNDKHFIRLGLAGGIQQSNIDLLKLRFPDQIDPNTGFVDANGVPNFTNELIYNNSRPTRITEEVTAGALYYNPLAFLGVTFNHITQPQQTFLVSGAPDARLPLKFSVYTGVKAPLKETRYKKYYLIPTLLYKMQGPFKQLDAGVYVDMEPVIFGLWYRGIRNPDAVVLLVGFKQGRFSMGYSYDYTISSLTNRVSGGSHEVTIVVEIEKEPRKRKRKEKELPCPRF